MQASLDRHSCANLVRRNIRHPLPLRERQIADYRAYLVSKWGITLRSEGSTSCGLQELVVLPHSTGMTRPMRHPNVPLLERAAADGSTDDVL